MMDIFPRASPSRGPGSPRVTGFYESDTGSCRYICIDEDTGAAALIDVVQQFGEAESLGHDGHKAGGLKKAVAALARRIAVIMHRMWIDCSEFRWSREGAAEI